MAIDSINSTSSLYFAAAQMAGQAASKSQKQEKTSKIRHSSFSNALEKSQKEQEAVQEGFPIEIASMDIEEAAVYLRDQADIAGDKLMESQLPENFAEYRQKISQFLRYLEKNNFKVTKKERQGFNSRGKPLKPIVQVKIIDDKLDEMARYLLSSHRDKLALLGKVNEIKGMLVDLLAA